MRKVIKWATALSSLNQKSALYLTVTKSLLYNFGKGENSTRLS